MTRQPMNDQSTGAKPQRDSATEGRASSISQHMMEEIRGRAEAAGRPVDPTKGWIIYPIEASGLHTDCLALLSSLQAAQADAAEWEQAAKTEAAERRAAQARVGVLEEIVRDLFETWDTRVALTRTGAHAALIDRIRAALSETEG
jgi:hypothetical protein